MIVQLNTAWLKIMPNMKKGRRVSSEPLIYWPACLFGGSYSRLLRAGFFVLFDAALFGYVLGFRGFGS